VRDGRATGADDHTRIINVALGQLRRVRKTATRQSLTTMLV
jgi:hypothetical protein